LLRTGMRVVPAGDACRTHPAKMQCETLMGSRIAPMQPLKE